MRLGSPSTGTGGNGGRKRPRFAIIFCPWGERATHRHTFRRNHPSVESLGKGGPSSPGRAGGARVSRTSPDGAAVCEERTPRQHPGGHRNHPRGLPAPGRRDPCGMAGARAVFCDGGADDAAHPGGRGSGPAFAQTGRNSAEGGHRSRSCPLTGHGSLHPRSGRGIDGVFRVGSAPSQGRRVALFRRID